MQFQFSFKNVASSNALKQSAQEKLKEKISKFATKPIEAQVTFTKDVNVHHIQCSFISGDGFSIAVDAKADDFNTAIDLVVQRLATKLQKQKEKLKSHKGNAKVRDLTKYSAQRQRWDERDGPEYVDAEDILKYEQALRQKRA